MAKKPTIETPGAQENLNEQLTTAQAQVNNIQNKATNITDAIALNNAIIDDHNSLEDEKEQAQLKINALLAAQEEINNILGDAQTSLSAIQLQAQTKAATSKKTDMSNITVSKNESKIITGPNITLTDKGYVIKPREAVWVKE